MPNTLKLALSPSVRLWGARLALVVAVAYFLLRVFLPWQTATTSSYPAYYTAAWLVIHGQWSPQLYNDKWFEARVLELTDGRVSDHFSLHPPTTSLLLVPIAWLDITTARVLWEWFNLALLLASVWFLLDALDVQDNVLRILFFAFALVYPPLAENLRVGQSYILVLFLFVLALWGETKKRPIWTGIGLGIAAGLKLSGAPIWFVLIVRREWRALLWSFLVAGLSAALGWVTLGTEGWVAFLQRVLASFKTLPVAAHVSFQTTPSFFQRLFVSSPDFNPAPLFDLPWLAGILNIVVTLTALGLLLWFARRAPLEFAFAAAVTGSVILFPMASEYHYTLLLIPLAVMGLQCVRSRNRFEIVWLVIILFLLCMPFNWNAPHWSTREWMLLAYPRLYGGWLLWLWLLKQMAGSPQANIAFASGATP